MNSYDTKFALILGGIVTILSAMFYYIVRTQHIEQMAKIENDRLWIEKYVPEKQGGYGR